MVTNAKGGVNIFQNLESTGFLEYHAYVVVLICGGTWQIQT